MDMVESLAKVSQLETKKTSAETYQTFYQLYGEDRIQEMAGHVILSRVLHIDADDSRDVHVVVARANQSMNLPIHRARNRLGLPVHRIPYSAADFLVASTDGITIVQHEVLSVRGTYRAELNCVDRPYDPWYETLHFNLSSDEGQSSAEFRASNGEGVFNLDGRSMGWILSAGESQRIRDSVLQAEAVPHIGHTAVAS